MARLASRTGAATHNQMLKCISGRRDEAGSVAETRVRALLQAEERAEKDQAQTLPVLRLPGNSAPLSETEWRTLLAFVGKISCLTDTTRIRGHRMSF